MHRVFLSFKKIRENFDLKGPSHKNAFSNDLEPRTRLLLFWDSPFLQKIQRKMAEYISIPPQTDLSIEALIFVKFFFPMLGKWLK